jgi:hypothetical protein
MTITSDGEGDKGPAIQEDSDRQADGYGDDDPYIVFGYGSLIFRVRSQNRFATTTGANQAFVSCVVASTSRHQKEYAYSSLSLLLSLFIWASTAGHSVTFSFFRYLVV